MITAYHSPRGSVTGAELVAQGVDVLGVACDVYSGAGCLASTPYQPTFCGPFQYYQSQQQQLPRL